jgi:microcompartment protein CcmL/EutN
VANELPGEALGLVETRELVGVHVIPRPADGLDSIFPIG